MQHIDRIIRSKNVFTAQDGIDTARELAIAIAGDRIVAVGAPDDVIAAAPGRRHVGYRLRRAVCLPRFP